MTSADEFLNKKDLIIETQRQNGVLLSEIGSLNVVIKCQKDEIERLQAQEGCWARAANMKAAHLNSELEKLRAIAEAARELHACDLSKDKYFIPAWDKMALALKAWKDTTTK